MSLSIVFIIVDLLAVTPVISLGVINPFWKFAFVFKCLTDTIILDDFKTALDKLSRHRRSQILPIDDILGRQSFSYDHQNLRKQVSWRTGSEEPHVERIEEAGREDGWGGIIRYPPKAL